MDYFKLIRTWFDFAFENPEKVKPNHIALYVFCVEHCNRLGWKPKFGLPTEMAKDAIGIRSYNTYINTFNDLIEFGFIKLIEKSKNQYSSNIIALSNFNKALDKALDKASIKHVTKHSIKQGESTVQSIDSIIKHITLNKYTNIQLKKLSNFILDFIQDEDKNFIDEIYLKYPTKCPIKNSSTGKSLKDKDKIRKLLKIHSKDHLIKVIEQYTNECIKSNTYMKNFSTFLNNLPDMNDNDQEDNKIKKQTKTSEERERGTRTDGEWESYKKYRDGTK